MNERRIMSINEAKVKKMKFASFETPHNDSYKYFKFADFFYRESQMTVKSKRHFFSILRSLDDAAGSLIGCAQFNLYCLIIITANNSPYFYNRFVWMCVIELVTGTPLWVNSINQWKCAWSFCLLLLIDISSSQIYNNNWLKWIEEHKRATNIFTFNLIKRT